MRLPLLLFIVVPFLEILLLLKLSEYIGALYTIGLVLLTAFIGVNLIRRQGLSTLLRFQDRLRSGEIPAQEIVEGMLIAFSGALLLTPGLLTDAIGFTCLLPPVRRLIAKRVLRSGNVFFTGGSVAGNSHFYYRETRDQDAHTFEGEFRDETRPRPTLEERDDD